MRVYDATGIADQAMMPHMRQLKAMGASVSGRNPFFFDVIIIIIITTIIIIITIIIYCYYFLV